MWEFNEEVKKTNRMLSSLFFFLEGIFNRPISIY